MPGLNCYEMTIGIRQTLPLRMVVALVSVKVAVPTTIGFVFGALAVILGGAL